ncbi:MAG: AAA family ATPase [Verrucomicrobia bacterium]|nr:AAA family ATPase [Verrucomicrobiota bacterium]
MEPPPAPPKPQIGFHVRESAPPYRIRRRIRGAQLPSVITTINTQIATALSGLTSGVRPQDAKLDFATETVLDVARALRFKLADTGLSLEGIRQSGLGYSNLLFMATVIVELPGAKEADLTLFLVEEPEAHLHPQLQMLVLGFLLEKARESSSAKVPSGQPEGRIQVIVSTHSPNLTAGVSPKHLVVVRSQRLQGYVQASGANGSPTHRGDL